MLIYVSLNSILRDTLHRKRTLVIVYCWIIPSAIVDSIKCWIYALLGPSEAKNDGNVFCDFITIDYTVMAYGNKIVNIDMQ